MALLGLRRALLRRLPAGHRHVTSTTCRVGLQNAYILRVAAPHRRNVSTQITPVDLSSDAYIPPHGNTTEGALVILHGIFGSKRNFASLCKAFMRDLNRPVYALDLRNHGSSPKTRPMDYLSMAADVHHFVTKNQLEDISLLGHSMGGKVAMTVALSGTLPALSNLIVSDISPTQTCLPPAFTTYLKAMAHIEDPASAIRTREQADDILKGVEKNLAVRQFLLTNLKTPSDSSETVKFKIPVDILLEATPAIGSFPFIPGPEHQWHGRTLVVKGAKSDYIKDANVALLRELFPNARLEVLDTGHWVHAEKPNEFKKLVVDFILGQRD
ncbi:putative alpha beta-hydrolase [Lyophyllum shimeji]|uniref:Alpha beta-hydrolase n=1 Tax=Lyophyllum shimeji TaxID=47721 RepID=A0A9P3URA3_LYOSH|nr:putative alpha beta-hydrolase [Lyophyllum shimeji]